MFLSPLKHDNEKQLFLKLSCLVSFIDNHFNSNEEDNSNSFSQAPLFFKNNSKESYAFDKTKTDVPDSEIIVLKQYVTHELLMSINDFELIFKSVETDFVKATNYIDQDDDDEEKNVPEEIKRVKVASKLVRKYIREAKLINNSPSLMKSMLIELMFIMLADGSISDLEEALVKKITTIFELDDEVYNELLDAAKAISREVVKATAIILE